MAVILVLEDDRVLTHLIIDMLKPEGDEVLPAATGIEALRIVMMRQGQIDLAIVDHALRGKERGTKFTHELTQLFPDIKVLFMTATPGNLKGDAQFVRGTPVLEKPFLGDELRSKVRALVPSMPINSMPKPEPKALVHK